MKWQVQFTYKRTFIVIRKVLAICFISRYFIAIDKIIEKVSTIVCNLRISPQFLRATLRILLYHQDCVFKSTPILRNCILQKYLKKHI